MRSPAGSDAGGAFFLLDPETSSGRRFSDRYLQWPVLIVFSVQLATEFTSAAAPRTVLQPAIVRALPTKTTVTSFRTMIAPPFCVRNNHDRSYGCLSSS